MSAPLKVWLADFLPRHMERFAYVHPPWPESLGGEEGLLIFEDFHRRMWGIRATYAEAEAASVWLKDSDHKQKRFSERHPELLKERIVAARLAVSPAAGDAAAADMKAAAWRYRHCPTCSGTGLAWLDAPPGEPFSLDSAELGLSFQARRAVFTCTCPAGAVLRHCHRSTPGGCPWPELAKFPALDPRNAPVPDEPEPDAARRSFRRLRLAEIGKEEPAFR